MKKHSLCFAFLAFFAIPAFFVSCGGDDPINLESDSTYRSLQQNLVEAIGLCASGDPRCPAIDIPDPGSSSSPGGDPGPGGSSDSNPDPGGSSDSNPGTGGSSSSAVAPGPGILACAIQQSDRDVYVTNSIVPVVTCDGALVGGSGVTFTPPTDITVAGGQITFNNIGVFSLTARADCGGSLKTAGCPDVNVSPLPSNVYNVPEFTCSWNPSSNVIGGDPSTVSVAINSSNPTLEAHCANRKVFYVINPTLNFPDTAYVAIGAVQTSGTLTGIHGETWTWPPSGPVVFRSTITCNDGAKVGTESRNCAAVSLVAPPKATVSGTRTGTFTGEDYSSSSSRYYFIGSTPAFSHNITAITNNTTAKCDNIRLEIKGGTYSATSPDIPLSTASDNVPITGSASSFAPTTVLPNVTANTVLTGRLIATCRGAFDTLVTTTATLVPNPSLSGTCAWDVAGNRTTPAAGATPSGVRLVNGLGRCGYPASGVADFNLPGSAYSYNSVAWPPSPLLEQVYSGVVAKATCGSTTLTSSPACPNLNVTNVVCGVKADGNNTIVSLSTLCPNANSFDDVEWNVRPPSTNNSGARCFYVTNLTGDYGPQVAHRINGTSFVSGNGNDRGNAAAVKIDGGVYIYVSGNYGYMHNTNNATPGISPPFCHDGTHTLYCSIPSTLAASTVYVPGSYISCRSGNAPAGIGFTGTNVPAAWSTSPNSNWTSPSSSIIYSNVTASATCGTSGTLNASCGNISVVAVTNITIPSGSNVTLNSGTLYRVTFSNPNNGVVQCSSNGGAANDTVIGTYDGEELRIGDYNNLWMVNGARVKPNNTTHLVQLNRQLGCQTTW